jgi:hypothetical protein
MYKEKYKPKLAKINLEISIYNSLRSKTKTKGET